MQRIGIIVILYRYRAQKVYNFFYIIKHVHNKLVQDKNVESTDTCSDDLLFPFISSINTTNY